ncbi:MAG: molybdenum ABC transporter ATP-binding protein [Deltaproteobacteria bacterium]
MLSVDIKKRIGFGSNQALDLDISFSAEGGIAVLFGHSGAGKTTVLNAIAGVITPDEGRIICRGRVYFDSKARVNLPVQERKVGFVFQDYALFPHLTAEENIAYGIASKSRRQGIAADMLKLFEIGGKAKRYPHELSGGERQRVALARAVASEPSVMLLDEPLSAVDAPLRLRLAEEMTQIQKRLGIPFVYVTHSPAEALRVGDFAALLSGGKIIKQGAPPDVLGSAWNLESPLAGGVENIFLGRVLGHRADDGLTAVDLGGGCQIEASYHPAEAGSKVVLGIRSEDIIVSREPVLRTSARNLIGGLVKEILISGARAEITVDCGADFKASVTPATVRDLNLEAGARVYLLIKARSCRFLI